MALEHRRLEDLVIDDIQALINGAVAEGKTIDYKATLPESTDEKKKEFLADVTSFANTAGGHLVYGVRERDSLPTEILHLDVASAENEIMRIDNLIRDGISPRIPGVAIHPVRASEAGYVFVVRVPRSLAAPHMVALKNDSKFYARNSKGKYQLDVGELRLAFAASEALIDRLTNFRLDRIARIIGGETPAPLRASAKVVLHLLPTGRLPPISPFHPLQQLGYGSSALAHPITGGITNEHSNFDGFVFSGRVPTEGYDFGSYLQVFRDGIIEAVDDYILEPAKDSDLGIPHVHFEQEIIDAVTRYARLQSAMGCEAPMVIFLSLLGVKGYKIALTTPRERSLCKLIDRDNLLLQAATVESYNFDAARVLKPLFDRIWNACGFMGSRNYDDAGNWSANRP